MVGIDLVYEGALHTSAVHGPSGSTLATDAPRDNEGLGESFSPTDLLAAALGSCILTTMGIVARRHEWPIEGSTARIEKHMTPQPGRRVGRLVVEFSLPELDERARTVLERAAHTCPVHRSLHPDVELDLRFLWGAGPTAPRP